MFARSVPCLRPTRIRTIQSVFRRKRDVHCVPGWLVCRFRSVACYKLEHSMHPAGGLGLAVAAFLLFYIRALQNLHSTAFADLHSTPKFLSLCSALHRPEIVASCPLHASTMDGSCRGFGGKDMVACAPALIRGRAAGLAGAVNCTACAPGTYSSASGDCWPPHGVSRQRGWLRSR